MTDLGARLERLGFEPRARQTWVRQRGTQRASVKLVARRGATRLEVSVTDSALGPGWRAGTFLHHDGTGRREAAEVVRLMQLLVKPRALLALASRRYVPGLEDPEHLLVFFHHTLGREAATQYARALLRARPELWPAVLGAQRAREPVVEVSFGLVDHGSQLGRRARALGLELPDPPAGAVASRQSTARHLRCFFGRQLRAWGEPEAAARLARVPDAALPRLRRAQERLGGPPLVDNVEAVRLVLAAVGTTRAPRRRKPSPRLFQYFALHGPFGAR
ncbi:MAG: hypothetical protein ACOZQL_24310 [Myxococcota bacterium]